MRIIRRLSSGIVGFVLFMAGFLKLMDPVGTGLIVEEYMKFIHLFFLLPAAKFFGITAALAETLTGAALLTGVWRRAVSWICSALILFFTLLTLALVIWNPEMNCGCFGEAIPLTHLQSFIKNLILCALCAIAFFPRSSLNCHRKVKHVSFSLAAVSIVVFSIFGLRSVPPVDFTAFAAGNDLGTDETLLTFCDEQGVYRDEEALHGPVILISAYDPDCVSDNTAKHIDEFTKVADGIGYKVIKLDSGGGDNAFAADRRTLMTLNRSNGGATLVHDGLIVRKWSAHHLPGREKLTQLIDVEPMEAVINENNGPRLKTQAFLLYVFAVMLLL